MTVTTVTDAFNLTNQELGKIARLLDVELSISGDESYTEVTYRFYKLGVENQGREYTHTLRFTQSSIINCERSIEFISRQVIRAFADDLRNISFNPRHLYPSRFDSVAVPGYGRGRQYSGFYNGSNWRRPEIEKVIFNDPATIVLWADGTKTVVKAVDEGFDPEKGLAMAISKKALGNEGNYYNTIRKHVGEYYEKEVECLYPHLNMNIDTKKAIEAMAKFKEAMNAKFGTPKDDK